MPSTALWIERDRVGRRQLVRDHDAGEGGAGIGLAGERLHHPPPNVEHVHGALAQQRLIELAVARRNQLRRVVPGALRRRACLDLLVRRHKQRLVVEQCKVSVEDLRLGAARPLNECLAILHERLSR